MLKVEYELLSKSVIQMFSKNRDIHSHDTRNKDFLRVTPGTKNFTYLTARKLNAIVSKMYRGIHL